MLFSREPIKKGNGSRLPSTSALPTASLEAPPRRKKAGRRGFSTCDEASSILSPPRGMCGDDCNDDGTGKDLGPIVSFDRN
mmetsp:Transcript_26662/g.62627  ORF Transcript_26662/g.62627 Transcript_26662/m.62627 type:complete len:81 (-) Transcript_26662:465-707(-)